MSVFKVGDRVQNRPDLAHLWDGTPWKDKHSRFREGTVVEVPKAAETSPDGHSTIRVDWDDLTEKKEFPENWLQWVHSTNVRAAE